MTVVVYGKVKGTVKDSAGRAGAGASVVLGGLSTMTASDGSYQFPQVPHGQYSMNVSKGGYITVSRTLFVTSSTLWTVVDVKLSPTGSATPSTPTPTYPTTYGHIRGYVWDKHNQRLPRVKVTLGSTIVTTDKNGYYEFKNVKAGNYRIYYSATGYAPQSRSATVTATKWVWLSDVQLTEAFGTITGKVAARSTPVYNALVTVNAPGVNSAYTDKNGNYSIVGVPAGNYSLSLQMVAGSTKVGTQDIAHGYSDRKAVTIITGTVTADFTISDKLTR